MSRGKGRKGKAKSSGRRRSTPISGHKSQGKRLVAPFNALPGPMQALPWDQQMLPDMLWIAAMLGRRGDVSAVLGPQTLIDEVLGEARFDFDGRISRFGQIPAELRDSVRGRIEAEAPAAMDRLLGVGLSLYEDCPASWLLARPARDDGEREDAVHFVSELTKFLLDGHGVLAMRCRMMVLARWQFTGSQVLTREDWERITHYPAGLDGEERARFESTTRAGFLAGSMVHGRDGRDPHNPGEDWARHFWQSNLKLASCVPTQHKPEWVTDDDEPDTEIATTNADQQADETESVPFSDRHRKLMVAIEKLADELRAPTEHFELDLYEPTTDEVRLGLASRQFRLLSEVASDPSLWAGATGAHAIRSMVESRILIAWLLQQDDPALYERFRAYGMGKLKLFKLHLEEELERLGADADSDALLVLLDAQVNAEILEDFQDIDLGGNFAGRSLRNMAIEADLKPAYTLQYQPLSAEAHGEWSSLTDHDLQRCAEPLHRGHRLGRFHVAAHPPSLNPLLLAINLAEDGITEIFASYGHDTTVAFRSLRDVVQQLFD